MTLTEFLLERIAEDEADADRIVYDNGGMNFEPHGKRVLRECEAKRRIVEEHPVAMPVECVDGEWLYGCERCADYNDAERGRGDWRPGGCPTLRALASVYSDHPDFREEWRA